MGSGDPLDLISDGREKLAVEDRSGWADVALSDRMLAVAVERERLEAEWLRLTAEWDARGAWAADGRVSSEKIDLLAEAARHREEFYERDEELLLDLAHRLDTRDLAFALRTWRMLADDEAADDDTKDAFDRVHLDIANGLLGSELAGFLDPHGSTVLANALDLIEPPDPTSGPDLPRTLSQRRGEGLVKLAQHYLDTRNGVGGHAVPSVSVVFTPEHDRWLLEDHRCELEGFGPVPRSTVARLACDARTTSSNGNMAGQPTW